MAKKPIKGMGRIVKAVLAQRGACVINYLMTKFSPEQVEEFT